MQRSQAAMAGIASATALVMAAGFACSKGQDGRNPSQGGEVSESEATAASATAASTGTTTGASTATVGGTGTGTASTVSTGTVTGSQVGTSTTQGTTTSSSGAKTLEQCQASNQAWRAVVSGGTQPPDCVEQLVSWCCTRQEVDQRFPSVATQLEASFGQFIDTEGNVLYACSVDTSGKYTFHMGKIVNGTTTYRTAFVSGVFPVTPTTPVTNCPAITTSQLSKASLR